jgi:Helix-turn-helix domain
VSEMEANRGPGGDENVHGMSSGELDELLAFTDDPEFLRACELGRVAFFEAVIENSARRAAEIVRRQRLDLFERSASGGQRGPRFRAEVRLALPNHVEVGVRKGARVTGTQRAQLVSDLRKQYEKGVSIRTLAQTTGRSYGFVHRLLKEAGVELRGRRGATRSEKET